ncbi:MAG: hypothetical protein ACRD0K_01985 [Egibacteraceae bacterium]
MSSLLSERAADLADPSLELLTPAGELLDCAGVGDRPGGVAGTQLALDSDHIARVGEVGDGDDVAGWVVVVGPGLEEDSAAQLGCQERASLPRRCW